MHHELKKTNFYVYLILFYFILFYFILFYTAGFAISVLSKLKIVATMLLVLMSELVIMTNTTERVHTLFILDILLSQRL